MLAGVPALSAAALSFGRWYSRRTRRRFQRVPLTTTRSFDERAVGRLVGDVRAIERALRAPLSGRPCVYYWVELSVYEGRFRRRLCGEERGRSFALDDGHGSALLDPADAELVIGERSRYCDGLGADAAEVQAFLARHACECPPPLRASLVAVEMVLEPGARVAVIGRGVRESDPDPRAARGYRDSGERVVLSSTPREPVRVSDDPACCE
ncbi:hypothetical protein Hoch_0199 [Haliangium ochraceum DSM 14365]|uniref:RING-type E3 ubiquitin transferase n=2 Tax=Haliangium ochraceum TaxID=80816 RepID=D0LHH8_HALO1|nr:hypothetical protein Hoch_0199 [Haliangium ochraceum DSM 14365]